MSLLKNPDDATTANTVRWSDHEPNPDHLAAGGAAPGVAPVALTRTRRALRAAPVWAPSPSAASPSSWWYSTSRSSTSRSPG
jgi:hypothetical protein